MKKNQDEIKLMKQRSDLVAEITENQSKIRSLQRDIKKHEKQIGRLQISLEKVDQNIKDFKALYQRAFAFILKNDYDNNIDTFFIDYTNQHDLIDLP